MNDLIRIPCVMMRGGTSRGPFFLASDLPEDVGLRDGVLVAAMGSGHPLQIDGIGGGHPLTSKVAIVDRSRTAFADVDYLFAQVSVSERTVDTTANCGNMLAAVGPFAIEAGLVPAGDPFTIVRIHNVNTRKVIEARIRTPNGIVSYLGEAEIDGVPGSAAPIGLAFFDAAGARTGSLLPTGMPSETIEGVEVTCIDCAMPMVIASAEALGVTGAETPAELSADIALRARLEPLRLEAGRRMGLGDVSGKVTPKPVLVAPSANGCDLSVRYFMPHQCHPALATTGAVGIATACITEGTIPFRLAGARTLPCTLSFEHPGGRLAVELEQRNGKTVASILRTARRLFEGVVMVGPVS